MKAPFAQTQNTMKVIFSRFKSDFYRMIILPSDEEISTLRLQGQVYIDGTFGVVPSTFSQCVIIMVFDALSNLTIPCIWYLTTGKNEHIYIL
ncbi:hypothetical protein MXB_4823 [Myxobolus squamalis]|nr:hypothetical protein MXB_4823 [Myxobolus squamalis]